MNMVEEHTRSRPRACQVSGMDPRPDCDAGQSARNLTQTTVANIKRMVRKERWIIYEVPVKKAGAGQVESLEKGPLRLVVSVVEFKLFPTCVAPWWGTYDGGPDA